ncbi:MAG: outer membrane protein [Heliomarina sp.]|uniref:outer membrane protein n=1 Tax=Heliomarina sp. TaxID=2917556 RepID=UPI00405939C5
MKKNLWMGVAFLALSTTSAIANEWSGFYAGAGIGYLEVEPTGGANKDDEVSFGVHAGYRFDAGQWVFGGEFEYDWTDIDLAPTVSVDSVMRLKATAGYDLGQTLLYVAAGAAEVDVNGLGNEWGEFVGIGAAYAVSPKSIISVELLEHHFSDINSSGVDADAWSVNLRASWRF